MAAPLLQLKDIALTFGGTPLLAQAELSVTAGERVCLVGRNGSGKSTLLKIAAGAVIPDRGSVFVQPGASLRYMPQEPDFGGAATTLAYVESGLGPNDGPHQARQWLEQLGLDGGEEPAHLSGGEARRAALARALAPNPDILLLDEPFAALDEITRFKLNNDLLAVWRKLRKTVIFVTHSVFESVYLSQRVIVMTPRPGQISATIAIPAHDRTEAFRTSAEYAGYCRDVSAALAAASPGTSV